MRLIKDRRGSLEFAIEILIFMACAGLVLNIGMGHIAKAQLQTVVDSSSLAGALTAEPQKEVRLSTDENGETIVEEVITGLKISDHQKANEKALTAAAANGADRDYWEKMSGKFELTAAGSELYEGETGWAGRVTGDTTYATAARVNLAPGFLKLLGADKMPVYAESDSESFIQKIFKDE